MRDVLSSTEKEILKILGKKKMTIAEITEKYFNDPRTVAPMLPSNYIGGVIRRLSIKADYYHLPWKLVGQRDVRGKCVWREDR